MTADSGASERARPIDLLHLVLLFATAGVTLGLVRAVAEVQAHGYPGLGYWRNVLLTAREATVGGASWGLGVGLVVALGRAVAGLVPEGGGRLFTLSGWVDFLEGSRGVLGPYLALGAAGFLFLVAVGTRYHVLTEKTVTAAARATLLACLVVALSRLLVRLLRRRSRALREGLVAGLYLGSGAGLALGILLPSLYVFDLFDPHWPLRGFLLALGLLVVFLLAWLQAARRSRSRGAAGAPGFFAGWLLLLVPPALSLAVSARPGDASASSSNVVVIGIDTLRHDHAPLNGPGPTGRDLTPNLRRAASRGVVFENAISQAPWTMPAFASILTGEYPHEHGALSMSGYLRDGELTLAEVLREAGYSTGAVISHAFVNADHGFAQGFDLFDEDNDHGHVGTSSAGITDDGLDFLDATGDRPFFLFLHYFDPHYEYQNHKDWTFADDYSGWLLNQPMDLMNVLKKRHLLEEPDVQYLRDLYAEEIAYTDHEIGRFLEGLRDRGLQERTLLVVVADHGEEFLERGWLGHTTSLYEELVHVPLAIVPPEPPGASGAQGTAVRVAETVETRSVFGTVLEVAGVGAPGGGRPPSLASYLGRKGGSGSGPPEVPDGGRAAFSTVWLPDATLSLGLRVRLSSIRTDRWKLVLDYTRGRVQLFDLEEDPAESRDVSSEEKETFGELFRRLQAWAKEVGIEDAEAPVRTPSPELRRKLEALGYL
jgi:arylsulfatase A-like enzyme